MAILNITGFETGDASEAVGGLSGTASIVTSPVRTGTYALRCNPTTTGTGFTSIQSHSSTTGAAASFTPNTHRYLRFYFRYATKPSSNHEIICQISSGSGRGATHLEVRLDSSGNLRAYRSTTALATGATVLAANTWYRIEVKRELGTNAAWEVKIDGVSEISGTANFGASTGTTLAIGKILNRNSNTVDFFFDDVSVSDSGYPGAGAVLALLPNANGNYQTWSIGAGAGSHYENVDEVPHDSDTTYLLSSLGSGDAETEALQATATVGISGTIAVAKSVAIAKRNGGTNGAVRLRLRSGSTDSDTSADATTTASYALLGRIYETDPATSSAWTTSGLDAVETGLIERSTTNASRLTFTALMVDFVASTEITADVPVALLDLLPVAATGSKSTAVPAAGVDLTGPVVARAGWSAAVSAAGVEFLGVGLQLVAEVAAVGVDLAVVAATVRHDAAVAAVSALASAVAPTSAKQAATPAAGVDFTGVVVERAAWSAAVPPAGVDFVGFAPIFGLVDVAVVVVDLVGVASGSRKQFAVDVDSIVLAAVGPGFSKSAAVLAVSVELVGGQPAVLISANVAVVQFDVLGVQSAARHDVAVTPDDFRLAAVAPVTTRQAAVNAAGVDLFPVAPASAKSAGVQAAGFRVQVLTPAPVHNAAVAAVGVDLVGVAAATTKRFAVPAVGIEFDATFVIVDIPRSPLGFTVIASPLGFSARVRKIGG